MPQTLNSEQKAALKMIKLFLKHPTANTFVLMGYAGTGKTFLMQHLGKWLEEKEERFHMLASTGRAATVLRGKTGFDTKTVHGELYNFNRIDGDDDTIANDATIDKYGQMSMHFNLRMPDEVKTIYIIDEASMLSSEFSDNPFATFGSGILLADFFEAVGNNKLIFVGDPCQLPPVGQDISPALDMEWLEIQGRIGVSTTLEKIERTDTDILKLATAVRGMSLQESWPQWPKLPARGIEHVQLYESDTVLFEQYLKQYKEVGTNGVLAVARSNRKVQEINRDFREALYGKKNMPMQVGDVLLVTQNNYAVPLTNGDFVTVSEIGEIEMHVNLYFQRVKVKATLSEKEYEILLALDILHGQSINFTQEQMKAIMVDFSQRMRRKGVKPNSDKYRLEMLEDPYLNCLRGTYGYAVTCHKAQGGEWNDVFLFLDKGMYGMPRQELCRWWYTAVTRTRKSLHLTDDWWIA